MLVKYCSEFQKKGIWDYRGHRLKNQTDEDCATVFSQFQIVSFCELVSNMASDPLNTTAGYFSYRSLLVSSNQSDQSPLSFFNQQAISKN